MSSFNKGTSSSLMLLVHGKITEAEFIKNNPLARGLCWPSMRKLRIEEPELFKILLSRFITPVYRRRAISESLGLMQEDIKNLLDCGSSTAGALLYSDNGKLGYDYIAEYSLVTRVTFDMSMSVSVEDHWNDDLFIHLRMKVKISSMLRKFFSNDGDSWTVRACVLKRVLSENIKLRVEYKSGVTTIDVINPKSWSIMSIANELKKLNLPGYCGWIKLPSVITNHIFYVFIYGSNESTVDEYVKKELGEFQLKSLSTFFGE